MRERATQVGRQTAGTIVMAILGTTTALIFRFLAGDEMQGMEDLSIATKATDAPFMLLFGPVFAFVLLMQVIALAALGRTVRRHWPDFGT